MTRIARPNYKQRKAWAEGAEAFVKAQHNTTPKTHIKFRVSRFGFSPTKATITPEQMHIRRDSALRKRRVKPSMPKMPWDNADA